MPMDQSSGLRILTLNSEFTLRGMGGASIEQSGKAGGACTLNGRGQYLDGGDVSQTCIGNLSMCDLGVTFAAWVRPTDLQDASYIFDSGANGKKILLLL